mgnify:CR=1 FL=1
MQKSIIRMYGTTWCGDCKRAKTFFGEHRVPYEFIDIEDDADGLRFVEEVNDRKRIIPTIVFPDGSMLIEPSNAELAAKLGLKTRPNRTFYDLVIVGGGPAALTAALYAAREGIDTVVIERGALGGQAGITERLDNFPGFPEGIRGADFAERLVQQCRQFGVEILTASEVTDIGIDLDDRWVDLASGDRICGKALLLAPGSTYRRLNVPGEKDFIGAGVHFCATCDGPFYRGKDVLVVGGGNSAVEEGLFLTKFARQVTILTRAPYLTASKIAQDKALRSDQITILYETTILEFRGDKQLSSVVVRNNRTGETTQLYPSGVFVFIGLQPNTSFLAGKIELDEHGFILTDPTLQTNLPGVFAAGDARAGSTKQLVSAAGEGATTALMIRDYLKRLKVLPPRGQAPASEELSPSAPLAFPASAER